MIQGIPFWYGIGKAGAIGAVSGAVSFGIGSWAKTLFGELVTVGKALFQAGMHGLSGGLTSALESGSFKGFGAAFASGFASSLISSGVESLGQMDGGYVDAKTGKSIASYNSFGKSDWFKASMIASGGVSGGFSSMIAGGNFMDGFRQGLITAGLNHVAHVVSDEFQEAQLKNKIRDALSDPDGKPQKKLSNIEEIKKQIKSLFTKDMLTADQSKMVIEKISNLDRWNDGVTQFKMNTSNGQIVSQIEILYHNSAFESNYVLAWTILHEFYHAADDLLGRWSTEYYRAKNTLKLNSKALSDHMCDWAEGRAYKFSHSLDGISFYDRSKYIK